jgi:hypothetical protein
MIAGARLRIRRMSAANVAFAPACSWPMTVVLNRGGDARTSSSWSGDVCEHARAHAGGKVEVVCNAHI